MNKILCLVVLHTLCVCGVNSLHCPTPGPGTCTQQDQTQTTCSAGMAVDYCGFCVCAKALGERCAGPWNIDGTCGRNLRCNNDERDFNASGKCVPILAKQTQRYKYG
ncbi:venom protein 302-like [Penaeus japonicus]|uniref:venom protein 302-like n=1 Tax=Penaeus japonicus TaxID=27405 RepID=UPI001C7116E7|nr:venom protein 302-like [Penaeus japonicus]